MFREVGLAAIVNPVTATLTEVEREIGPLTPLPAPITLTV